MPTQNPVFTIALDLCSMLQQGDLQYIYRGTFTKGINDQILSLSENNLTQSVDNKSARKRIYFVMIEGLQNITRHQHKTEHDLEDNSIFVLQKQADRYYLTTGNIIKTAEVADLRKKLESVNSMTLDELKESAKERLITGELSKKGGAGLGLIEMARKSGNKLNFDFKRVNDDYSFFYFNNEIFTSPHNEEPRFFPLDGIKALHQTLNSENIILSFAGTFNQDTMLNFVAMIEQKMDITAVSLKLIKLLAEMFQNIVVHGENINNNPNGTIGTFFVSEKSNQFLLTSGNYIPNENVDKLREKIDLLNQMNDQELNTIYKQTMADKTPRKTAGLGLIDMRLKSKNKLTYHFEPVDDKHSFYTLQVSINQ